VALQRLEEWLRYVGVDRRRAQPVIQEDVTHSLTGQSYGV
jgi:hypothetical protein